MAENPGYGGFKPEEIISEKDRALGGDSAYWEKGGRGEENLKDKKEPVLEKIAEEVKKIEENPPKVEEKAVEAAPASVEKKKRVYKKRVPKNAPFEEVLPEEQKPAAETPVESPAKVGDVLVNEKGHRWMVTGINLDKESKGYGIIDTQDMESGLPGSAVFKDVGSKFSVEKPAKEEPAVPAPAAPGEETEKVNQLAEGEPANPNFDYEKILNDEEFLNFLAKYPDAEMVDPHLNKREIENRHRVYEAKNTLGAELAMIYLDEVAPEFGLPKDGGVTSRVVEALESEAIENPDNLIKKAKELGEYSRSRVEVAQKNERIVELVGKDLMEDSVKLAEAERKATRERSIKKNAIGWRGFFNVRNSELMGGFFRGMMTEEEREWHEQARLPDLNRKDRYAAREKMFAEVDKRIAEFAEATKLLKETRKADQFFAELRKEIVAGFIPTKLLFEEVQRKAGEALNDMLNKPERGLAGFKKIEEAQQYLERLKVGKKKFNLENLDPEAFQGEIDKRLDEIAQGLIRKHVAEFKISNKPLGSLLAGLYDLINKEKNPRNRTNIIETTIEVVDQSINGLKKEISAKKSEGAQAEIAKMYLLQVAKKKLEKAF